MSDTTVIDNEEDGGTVLIDVSDNPELVAEETTAPKPAAAAPKPAAPAKAAVEEAAAALTRSLAVAEAERTAALTTAEAERRRAEAATNALTARDTVKRLKARNCRSLRPGSRTPHGKWRSPSLS